MYSIPWYWNFFKNRRHVFYRMCKMEKRKFNVGSAGINVEKGWYATDIETLDITKEEDWANHLLFLKVDNIVAEHVWEHLNEKDTFLANRNCYKFLKKKGVLRIAVPDGFHPDPEYINYVKPNGSGMGAEDHKILYNYKLMKEKLEKVGFSVNLLEYWDEEGNFHFTDWSIDDGKIMRSKRYDERNSDGNLVYTSLIVDAIKD